MTAPQMADTTDAGGIGLPVCAGAAEERHWADADDHRRRRADESDERASARGRVPGGRRDGDEHPCAAHRVTYQGIRNTAPRCISLEPHRGVGLP